MNAAKIAEIAQASLEYDSGAVIRRTSSLMDAKSIDIAAVSATTSNHDIMGSKAGAILVPRDLSVSKKSITILRANDPSESLLRVMQYLTNSAVTSGIHPTACISVDAKVDLTARVGPYCVVESGAVIGPGCILHSHATVQGMSSIGSDSIIGHHATVHFGSEIGGNCHIDSGAVIGANASFITFGNGNLQRNIGVFSVKIGNAVTVGVNSVIERGVRCATTIESGTQIGPNTVVGHDSVIGSNCTIGGHVGISSRVKIANFVILMGQAGLSPGSVIEQGAVIGPKTGITGTVPAGAHYLGWWGRPRMTEMKRLAGVDKSRLEKLEAQFKTLEQSLKNSTHEKNENDD